MQFAHAPCKPRRSARMPSSSRRPCVTSTATAAGRNKVCHAAQSNEHSMSRHASQVAEVRESMGMRCILVLLACLAQHCPITIGHNGCVDHVMHAGKSWHLLDLQGAGTMLDCHRLEFVVTPVVTRPEGVSRASSAYAACWHECTRNLGIVNKDCRAETSETAAAINTQSLQNGHR